MTCDTIIFMLQEDSLARCGFYASSSISNNILYINALTLLRSGLPKVESFETCFAGKKILLCTWAPFFLYVNGAR